MSEPKTYTMPDEPHGPLWDKDGGRWDIGPAHGMWCGPDGLRLIWADVLRNHGPLTTAPPWKPEIGGIVETLEQFRALPEGSIIAADHSVPTVRNSSPDVSGYMIRPRTILRVGWSL